MTDHRRRVAPPDFCGSQWVVGALLPRAAVTGELHAIALGCHQSPKGILGWKAAVESVDGIQRTIQWLRATVKPKLPALVGA